MNQYLRIVCLLFPLIGFSQTENLDSLLSNLPKTINEEHIPLLHDVIKASWTSAPDTALKYGRMAIDLSIANENLKSLSTSYRLLGGVYNYMSLIDSGRYYKSKALEMAIELGDSLLVASSFNNLGVTAQTIGNYVEALSYYYLAYNTGKEIPEFAGLPIVMANISEVYYDLQEYDSAIYYARNAIDLNQTNLNSSRHLLILNALARAELAKGNYQNARSLYEKILDISEIIGEKRYAAYANQGLGKMYVQNKSIYPAKKQLFKALKLFQELDDNSYISEIYSDLSQLMIENDPDSSFYYAHRSIVLAEKLELRDIILNNYNNLIELFAQNNSIDSLQHYLKLYQKKDENIRKINNLNSIQGMLAKIRDEEMKSRLAVQTLALEQKTLQTNFLIALAVITLIFAVFFLRLYSKQKRLGNYLKQINQQVSTQNELIDKKNTELKALNNEKNDLIQIVAHDLKNPLSNIISAVEMAREDSANSRDTAHEIIDGSARRLSDMITKILDVESIEKGLSNLKLKPVNLTELVSKLCTDFQNQAKDKKIYINCSIDSGVFAIAEETYLYQVMENLMSNAIKFSPPERSIYVNLRSDEKFARIEVKDEGPGISEKEQKHLFQMYQKLSAKPTGNEHSSGVGLSVVKKFVDAMNGKIWCKSSLGAGTSFYAQFSLFK
ncbi:tetratricopeptide repeat-containing sensor histidine kinase [Ekhidna sp.]|uniref:tetratricopeptide repeat-containing sensor histidine kinase n=1 Tax=Ekhidna sp. TaxID=2608089 RepID=UPI003B51171C